MKQTLLFVESYLTLCTWVKTLVILFSASNMILGGRDIRVPYLSETWI